MAIIVGHWVIYSTIHLGSCETKNYFIVSGNFFPLATANLCGLKQTRRSICMQGKQSHLQAENFVYETGNVIRRGANIEHNVREFKSDAVLRSVVINFYEIYHDHFTLFFCYYSFSQTSSYVDMFSLLYIVFFVLANENKIGKITLFSMGRWNVVT